MSRHDGRKQRLLAKLSGTVLEIGAGRRTNLANFGDSVTWIGLEPDRRKRDALTAQLNQSTVRLGPGEHEVLAASAENIPLPDEHCQAVVSMTVLCSVNDQDATLAEVLRVLRPGGSFVFLEHVAARTGSWTRRIQRFVTPCTKRFDSGCDPVRDTAAAIERAGFQHTETESYDQPVGFGLRVPFIAGYAWKTNEQDM